MAGENQRLLNIQQKYYIIVSTMRARERRGERVWQLRFSRLADLAGVSRGTVDRALNNRGRIRPEVAEKIKEIAKELGYQPNMAAKALSTATRTSDRSYHSICRDPVYEGCAGRHGICKEE